MEGGRGGAVGRKSDGGQTLKLQAETVWGHLDWVRLVIPSTHTHTHTRTHTHTHTHTQAHGHAAATETSCSPGLHHSLQHLLKSTKTHNDVGSEHLCPSLTWTFACGRHVFLAEYTCFCRRGQAGKCLHALLKISSGSMLGNVKAPSWTVVSGLAAFLPSFLSEGATNSQPKYWSVPLYPPL